MSPLATATRPPLAAVCLTLLGGLALAVSAAQPELNFQIHPVVDPSVVDILGARACHINATGDIAGTYSDNGGTEHGFYWHAGTFTTLDAPGQTRTQVNGLNDQGQLVGYYDDGIDGYGFIYDIHKKTWSRLPLAPGASGGWGGGISNNGKIVGSAFGGSFETELIYYFDGKSWTFLSIEDAYGVECTRIQPGGVNDRGDVTGWYVDSRGQGHGFLRVGSVVTTIDSPASNDPERPWTLPYSINNAGDVVGTWTEFNPILGWYDLHGFVFRSGKMLTYDVPGVPVGNTLFQGINNKGQVLGTYFDPNLDWATVPFIATPVGGRGAR